MKPKVEPSTQKTNRLEDFLNSLGDDDLNLVFPEEVIKFDLKRGGFSCPDNRVIRLVDLAAMKFLGDVVESCNQIYQIQHKSAGERKKRRVLTVDILQKALKEHGIDMNKPMYYSDKSSKPVVAKKNLD